MDAAMLERTEHRKAKANRTRKQRNRTRSAVESGEKLDIRKIRYRTKSPGWKRGINARNRRNANRIQAERADEFGDVILSGDDFAVDTIFTGRLHGKNVKLEDVHMQIIIYKKRGPKELNDLREKFDRTERSAFLKKLGEKEDSLRMAGLSDNDISNIKKGNVPHEWQVHHKLPLDDGGTNEFKNLLLIKNNPYHKVITNYQNSIARNMKIGEEKKVLWPIPDGDIYPARGGDRDVG